MIPAMPPVAITAALAVVAAALAVFAATTPVPCAAPFAPFPIIFPRPFIGLEFARPPIPLPSAKPPANMPQLLFNPISIPKSLSTTDGPSRTAMLNAANAIRYGTPFNLSWRNVVPIIYSFKDRKIMIVATNILRILDNTAFNFCPFATSAGANMFANK